MLIAANNTAPRVPNASILAIAIIVGLLSSMSAWADPSCRDVNGNPVGTGTNLGNEHGDNNATCTTTSSAYGETNNASAAASSAIGAYNLAYGDRASAVGTQNVARGADSAAFGVDNTAGGAQSNAFGFNNTSSGVSSLAYGAGNSTRSEYSIAFGRGNSLQGVSPTFPGSMQGFGNQAFGQYNVIDSVRAQAYGQNNQIFGQGWDAQAFGNSNLVSGREASAFGSSNAVTSSEAFAVGIGNAVSGIGAIVVGKRNTTAVEARHAIAIGNDNIVSAEKGVAIGNGAGVDPGAIGGIVIGNWVQHIAPGGNVLLVPSHVTGEWAVAIGNSTAAHGLMSAAFGVNATADADYSVAIGYNAIADRMRTISVGSAAGMNQIANLADGSEDFDAVNLRQLKAGDESVAQGIASWLGGGAAFSNGLFTAPVYVIQSGNYFNVGAAFGAVDAALTDINQRIVASGGIQGERGYSAYALAVQNGFVGSEADWLSSLQGPDGPAGPRGPEGPAGGGPRMVAYDSDDRDTLTLAGANGTAIANVANGVADMDAVNLRQMRTGDAATLASANDYTDRRFAAWDAQLQSIQRGIDDRLHRQDRRIDRQGAMAGAFAGMAMNTAGLAGRNRIGVGIGSQGGEQALAVGYQRVIGSSASVSLGGAFGGSEKSVMGGAGFSW